jgi:P27 family predicted phage terminase small subunit
MGQRGPAPKPTAIRVLEGNPSGRPIPEDEPQLPALEHIPKAPQWVKGKGKIVWNSVLPTLVNCRVMAETDLLAFGRYCDVFEEYFRLRKIVKSVGSTMEVFDEKGRLMRIAERPEFKQYRTLNRDLLRMEQEFGLTPAARSRIRVLMNLEFQPPKPRGEGGGNDDSEDDNGFDFGDS